MPEQLKMDLKKTSLKVSRKEKMSSIEDIIPGNYYWMLVPNAPPEYLGKYDGLIEKKINTWGGGFEYRSIHYFPDRPEIRNKMGLPPIGWSDPTLLFHIPDGSTFVESES